MQTISQLKNKAILAAKASDWEGAANLNQTILTDHPDDIAALNRLGVALLQLGKKKDALATFQQVLAFDKTNLIAQKQISKIKANQHKDSPTFTHQSFIEEPGKTKSVELHRLAGKAVLETLTAGQLCELKPKNRYMSVSKSDGSYIGALPEDVSYRLSKLVATGNTYSCRIQSVSTKHCVVFLEETFRDPRNSNYSSFPTNKTAGSGAPDTEEQYIVGESIPLQIVETDEDEEKTFDDIPSDSLED